MNPVDTVQGKFNIDLKKILQVLTGLVSEKTKLHTSNGTCLLNLLHKASWEEI